jgi:hypothetical protein
MAAGDGGGQTFLRSHLPEIMRIGGIVVCAALVIWASAWRIHAGAAGLVLLLIFVLWRGPQWQLESSEDALKAHQRIDLENKCRATLAQILGGAVLLAGLYLTWRSVDASLRGVEASLQSVDVAREGQITERFTRAAEQLGSEKLEVRLGGIYALERIARDSERDHWPIMEVLTAYVRENAAWSDERDTPSQSVPLATDIQAVLTVLSRRTREWDEGRSLDLQRTDLRRAHLEGAHLERTNLFAAHLEGAMLTGAHLQEAHLSAARLRGARLSQAHLEGAMLMSAHLDVTSLEEAHLEGAWLQGASLQGADLRGADLRGVDLGLASDLTREQIESAITDEMTILPERLEEEGREESEERGVGE